jgi:hypothetical protein
MSRTEENIAKVHELCVKIVGCQEHRRASEHRWRNRKILTEDLNMRKVCAKWSQRNAVCEGVFS